MATLLKSVGDYCRGQLVRIVAKYEREFRGIDFQGGASPESLGLNPETANACMPSGGKYLRNVLKDLGVSGDDCILDIGCGKGDAMRTMLEFPFKMVHGLEVSDRIAAIAAANFRKLGGNRVQVFNVDAIEFDGYKNYNMFYLYNPFKASVIEAVFKSIINTNLGRPEILVIYNNPTCHEQVQALGFRKMREYPDRWGNGILLYSNKKVP